MDYAALNGDLVRSQVRGVEATRRLAETLKEANRRFDLALAAPFTLSKGAAFQGLFKTPSRSPEALLWLEAPFQTQGLSARYGVGLGAVEGLARRGRASSPARLTGEAFFRADAALGEAHKRRVLTAVRSADSRWDLAANAVFLLLDYIAPRWPPEGWQRMLTYLETGHLKAVARAEGVSYQAVHKQFATREVRAALRALSALARGLEEP